MRAGCSKDTDKILEGRIREWRTGEGTGRGKRGTSGA